MSDEVKKKPGPPRKAEVVKEAYEMGIGAYEALAKLTVAELKRKMSDVDLEKQYDERPDTGADCEHNYFRKVRIVDHKGNYVVQVCKHCGHKERIEP